MSQITKKALAQSLKKLLAKTPLNKITVRDIVEDCGVNRQTFYYHFQDIYDLLDWLFMQDIDVTFSEMCKTLEWKEWCEGLISYMKENKRLILNVCGFIDRVVLEEHMRKWMSPAVASLVEKFSEDGDYREEDKQFVINIYTIMISGLTIDWIERNMDERQLRNIDKLFLCMDGSISHMLKNLNKQ